MASGLSGYASRVCDVPHKPQKLVYIGGLEDWPTVSLDKAVENLPVHRIKRYAKASKRFAQDTLDTGPDPYGLTLDEIAALNLYTAQWSTGDSFFTLLNAALRAKDRSHLRH